MKIKTVKTVLISIMAALLFSACPAEFFHPGEERKNPNLPLPEIITAETPVITSQPAGATITVNAPHALSVSARVSDGGALSYQWYSNSSASLDGGMPISGATSTYYSPPTDKAGIFYYFAIITNTIPNNRDGGIKTASVYSDVATLTVNSQVINQVNAQTPAITNQPASATITVNGTHTLSVSANVSDGGAISYQWYSNSSASAVGGTIISGAASASYRPPTDWAGIYHYFVEITNTIHDNGDGGAKTASVRSSVATLTVNANVNISLVRIEGGTFTMGSPSNEPERNSDEGPQHQVTVSAFYMGKYQVTQAEYEAVMGTNPSDFKGSNLPVEYVWWYDAVEFCNRLSQQEGLTPAYTISGTNVSCNWNANGYRLPTEAEWEYACRAGTTSPFSTGSNITTSQANYDGRFPYNINANGIYRQTTTAVGSFAPNPWGLYDMHGNVYEWCWDWYGSYSSSAQTNPRGPVSGDSHVIRGGRWSGIGQFLRSAFRRNAGPLFMGNSLGFRLVRN
jgi:formylglycine-generating enzyme required for sulfatase activity